MVANDFDGPPADDHDTFAIPADLTAEFNLIGCIILHPDEFEGVDLTPDDFYGGRHAEVWRRMRELWDGGIVPLMPIHIAERDPELFLLCNEAANSPFAALGYLEGYVAQIKAMAGKRFFLDMAQKVAAFSLNGKTPQNIAEYMEAEVAAWRTSAETPDTWQLHSSDELIEPPAAREWLFEGLIYKGQLSLWFGPPGIQKSLLLMSLCAAGAVGRNWLVRRSGQEDDASLVTFRCTRPLRVLWLDYDNGEFETKIRIRAALKAQDGLGESTGHLPIYYMSETTPWLALDNPAHIKRIIAKAKAVKADIIVVDALGMVLGEVDENAPEVSRVIANLKMMRSATGAAIITVHHPSKTGAQSAQASTYNAAGSAKFSNFFEWTLELRKGEERDTLIAEVTKHRGWAIAKKFAAALSYLHFGTARPDLAHEFETFKFYPEPLITKEGKRKTLIRETVLTMLVEGELNQKQLIEAVKPEVEAVLHTPVGTMAIRDEVVVMAQEGALHARPTGQNRPVFYSLPRADYSDYSSLSEAE
jgi:hypothetical protein